MIFTRNRESGEADVLQGQGGRAVIPLRRPGNGGTFALRRNSRQKPHQGVFEQDASD